MSTRHTFTFSLLGLLLWGSTLQAQAVLESGPLAGVGDASGTIYNGIAPIAGLDGGYLWFQGNFGERPGNPGSFFSTGGIAPIQVFGPNQALVVDSQIWVTDNRNIGGNFGLNQRWLVPELSSIFGLNAFFTWDHTENENDMKQFSVGAEWTTEWLKVDGNYYVPFSDNPQAYGAPILTNNCVQQGNGFVFIDLLRAEQQMSGGDLEAGTALPYLEWVSIYGGAYWMDASLGESVQGASGRVEADLNSMQLGLAIYNDNVFGTSVNANATLLLGAGPIAITPRRKDLYAHLSDRTRRRTRIGVQQTTVTTTAAAINPNTGLAYNILTVDNTAAPGGTGTFENPFDNLSDASNSAADIIFVRRGTTTQAAPLAGGPGLVLTNNQIVIGEGTPYQLAAANRPGVFCTLSAAGANPFVTSNAGTNVITLANNNQVWGLNIIAPNGGSMIAGNNVEDFQIHNINNNMVATTGPGAGIVLTNATGLGVIENFRFLNAAPVNPGGIVIRNTNAPPLDLQVSNADITGGLTGVELRANNSDINAILNDVQNTNSGFGLQLRATNNGNVNANITNSAFLNATNNGLHVLANTGGDVTLNGNNLTVNGAGADALHSELDNGTTVITLMNSNLSLAGDDAIDGTLTNGASLSVTTNNVNGLFAGGDAIVLSLDQVSQATFNLTQGSFSGAGNDAIDATLLNGSALTINTNNILFQNAGSDGLIVTADNGSTFDGNFIDSSFQNAQGGNGVGVTLSNTSTGNLTLNGTGANMANMSGLFFDVTAGSNFTANLINGVSLDDAGSRAIDGNVMGFSTATINGNGVSGAMAGDDAIHLVVAGSSQLDMTMQNSGSFADAAGDGFELSNTGTSTANITFNNGGIVNFSGAGANGLLSNTGTNSNTNFNFENGANFDGVGLDAIRLLSNNNATTSLTGPAISGANAGGDGIDLVALLGSTTMVNLTNVGSFTSAGGDALKYLGTGGSTINVNIAAPVGVPALFDLAGDQGIDGVLQSSTGNITLANIDFSNATNDGMALRSNDSTLTANLTNLNFDDATNGDAIRVQSHNGSTSTVNGNGLSGANAGDDAIRLEALGGSTNNFILTNTGSFTTPNGDGVDFLALNGSTLNMNISAGAGTGLFDNAVTGNGVRGTSTNSTLNMIFNGLNFGGANLAGLNVVATNTTLSGNTTNTSFNGAGTDGMNFVLNNTTGTYTLSTVNANNNNGRGLAVNATNNSLVTFNANALNLDNSLGSDALQLIANNSRINFNGTNVRGLNAAADGIHVDASNTGRIDLSLSGQLLFADAGDDAFSYSADNGTVNAVIAATPTGAFYRAGGHGANGTLLNGSTASIDLQNLNFANADANGFQIVSNDSTFTASVLNSTFSRTLPGTTENALNAILDNNMLSTLTFTSSQLNNALVDGLHVEATTNTIFNLNLAGGTTFSGAMDNQDITADGTSTVNFNILP